MTAEEVLAKRQEIVTEARSWIGTPYRLGAAVKQAGADCSTLLYACYRNCDLVPEEKIGVFSYDWFAHVQEDKYWERVRYLLEMRRLAYQTAEAVAYQSTEAAPGSLVLLRAGGARLYNHGGIVLAWPRLVHAITPAVKEVDASRDPLWACQRIRILDPFGGQATE